MRPLVSAVVCTRDRDAHLRACVESLVRQSLPVSDYEILVVDNGSDDTRTAPALGDLASRPNLRMLREPRPGLSLARNRGWSAARGELVAFLDDDARASRGWLERLVAVFEEVRPRPGCAGGRVEPVFDAARPPWLGDELLGGLGAVDWSASPTFLRADQWLPGCNLAVPRARLEEVGGFSPRLGRRGRRLHSMEEIHLQERLARAGHRAYYDPRARVRHHVGPERLTRLWFLRRAYWNGVSRAHVHFEDAEDAEDAPPSRWERLRLARRALGHGASAARARERSLMDRSCAVVGWLGYAGGMLGPGR